MISAINEESHSAIGEVLCVITDFGLQTTYTHYAYWEHQYAVIQSAMHVLPYLELS